MLLSLCCRLGRGRKTTAPCAHEAVGTFRADRPSFQRPRFRRNPPPPRLTSSRPCPAMCPATSSDEWRTRQVQYHRIVRHPGPQTIAPVASGNFIAVAIAGETRRRGAEDGAPGLAGDRAISRASCSVEASGLSMNIGSARRSPTSPAAGVSGRRCSQQDAHPLLRTVSKCPLRFRFHLVSILPHTCRRATSSNQCRGYRP